MGNVSTWITCSHQAVNFQKPLDPQISVLTEIHKLLLKKYINKQEQKQQQQN